MSPAGGILPPSAARGPRTAGRGRTGVCGLPESEGSEASQTLRFHAQTEAGACEGQVTTEAWGRRPLSC